MKPDQLVAYADDINGRLNTGTEEVFLHTESTASEVDIISDGIDNFGSKLV